jgi:hypothetical protein
LISLEKKAIYFATTNIALIGIFSAPWIALNLTVAPLGFRLLQLPIIHGAIVFLLLLLVIWATNQYGVASAVGIIGSVIVLLAGGPLPVVGFAVASLLFDMILSVNHHKIDTKLPNLAIAVLTIIICSCVAGIVNGIFILNQAPVFALTVWGSWTVVGGVIGIITTLPVIGVLEKAQVRKIREA